MEQVRFADAYSFLYSPRPQTKALELADPVSAEEKQRWFEQLLAVQGRISAEIWHSDLHQVQQILVEGSSRQGDGQMFGRSQWNRIVNFDGPADLVGEMVPVRIVDVKKNSHLGVLDCS